MRSFGEHGPFNITTGGGREGDDSGFPSGGLSGLDETALGGGGTDVDDAVLYNLTPSQQRAFAIAPKPAAFLSFVASLYVVHQIVIRHSHRKARLYHRIVLVMMISATVQSVNFFWGTWAMPSEVPGYTAGNVATCTVQGFLNQLLCFVVPFYYASLSVYSIVAVRNDFKEERMKWLEKWIHVCVWPLPLLSAAFLAAGEYFNPAVAFCWIDNYPQGCGDEGSTVECSRGGGNVRLIRGGLAGLPMMIFLLFATAMMIILHRTVHRIDERRASFAVGKNRIVEQARKERAGMAARQAAFYLLLFYVSNMPLIAARFITFATGKTVVLSYIVAAAVLPLQGFLNAIVYECLILRRNRVSSTSEGGIGRRRTSRVSSLAASVAMARPSNYKPTAVEEQGATEAGGSDFEFSIFDGTNASDSPWAAFLDPSDSDDDEEEANGSNGIVLGGDDEGNKGMSQRSNEGQSHQQPSRSDSSRLHEGSNIDSGRDIFHDHDHDGTHSRFSAGSASLTSLGSKKGLSQSFRNTNTSRPLGMSSTSTRTEQNGLC